MDSIDVRNGYWSKSWIIPGTNWTICGYSRAAYRTGYYIKTLDLMLDAGPQCFNQPKHIMITHMHDDHIAELPLTLITNDDTFPTIYAPISSEQYLKLVARGKPYRFYGLNFNQELDLVLNKTPCLVKIFKCDHGEEIDTISFGISQIKNKLKQQYLGLSKDVIKQLKLDGFEITERVEEPKFVFLCDTSIKIFQDYPDLFRYPVIFIECTFYGPDDENKANMTKHIHWNQLKPIVQDHPETIFVLFHFSLIYGSDTEIRKFFDKDGSVENLKIWA